jgi:hypothetical protein
MFLNASSTIFRKLKIIRQGSLFFLLILPLFSVSQNKFQYIAIEYYGLSNDSINYSIDTTGLDNSLKLTLKGFVTNNHRFHTEFQLFNKLGSLGWELIQVETILDNVVQVGDFTGRNKLPAEFFLKHSTAVIRKIYFKKTLH